MGSRSGTGPESRTRVRRGGGGGARGGGVRGRARGGAAGGVEVGGQRSGIRGRGRGPAGRVPAACCPVSSLQAGRVGGCARGAAGASGQQRPRRRRRGRAGGQRRRAVRGRAVRGGPARTCGTPTPQPRPGSPSQRPGRALTPHTPRRRIPSARARLPPGPSARARRRWISSY